MTDTYIDKIVCVIWIDSYGGGGWVDISDYKPSLSHITTYGKFVKETDEYYTIVSTYSDDQYMDPLSIPIVSVKGIAIIDVENAQFDIPKGNT